MLDFAHAVPTTTTSDDHVGEPPPMHVRISKTGDMRHKLVAGSQLNSWHELTVRPQWKIIGPRTSCGEHVAGYYAAIEESYDGELCPTCFTPFEIEISREIAAVRAEEARLELLKHGGRTKSQRRRLHREITQGAAEESKRLTTERMKKLMPDGSPSDEGEEK